MQKETNNKRVLSEISPEKSNIASKRATQSSSTAAGPIIITAAMSPSTGGDVFSWKVLNTTMSDILDAKLQDVARKSDLAVVKEEVAQVRAVNAKLNEEIGVLKSRLELIDRTSRRNRIIIRGLTSTDNNSAVGEMYKLFGEVLQVNVNIHDIFKLNNRNSFAVTLASPEQVRSVLAKSKLLKGSAVYIDNDLTKNEQEARFQIRTLARKLSPLDNLKIRPAGRAMYLNDKKFIWSDGKIIAGNPRDAAFIKSILSKQLLEFDVVTDGSSNRFSQISTGNNL